MAERIVGIDFGTSTSVIRVKRYNDNGDPVGDTAHFDSVTFNMGSTMVPTLILEGQGSTFYGYDAQINNNRKMQMFENFKVDLESEDEEKRNAAKKLTADYFSYLGKTYNEQSAGGHLGDINDNVKTYVSYPVKWSEDTKQFMLETARKAGFPNVEGMDEAQAAISAVLVQNAAYIENHGYLKGSDSVNILLIDMGAGTTDLVLCRYNIKEKKSEIICTWPLGGDILFGGREVDVILGDCIKEFLPEDKAEIILKKAGTDKFKTWKEATVSAALKDNKKVISFNALEDLLFAYELEDTEFSVDRESFEKAAADYLCKLPVLVNGCINEGKLDGAEIDLVVITGGHSQWYFVNDILSGKMKNYGEVSLKKITEDNDRIMPIVRPQETVALGLVYSKLCNKPVAKTEDDALVVENVEVNGSMGLFKIHIPAGKKISVGDEMSVYKNGKKTGTFTVDSIGYNSKSLNEATEGMNVSVGIKNSTSEISDGDIIVYEKKRTDSAAEKVETNTVNANTKARISISVTPPGTGIVYGSGTYKRDTKVTLKAAPVSGYRFAKWNDGVKYPIRTVIAETDITYRAEFEEIINDAEMYTEEVNVNADVDVTPLDPDDIFELDSVNNCYKIKKYKGPGGHVVIPETIRGRRVVAIGKNAFNYTSVMINPSAAVGAALANRSVISVEIPDTVTVIEQNAFLNCRALENVKLSKNLTTIMAAAFNNCRSLKSIEIPAGVKEIPLNAFFNCKNLEMVSLPMGIEKIDSGAFGGCSKLSYLTFGNQQNRAGFVSFPRTLKVIGSNAFSNLNNMTMMYMDCIFKEVLISRNTKVKEIFLNPKTFKNCAVFYYEDQ